MKWYFALPVTLLLAAGLTYIYADPLYSMFAGTGGAPRIFMVVLFVLALFVVDFMLSRILPARPEKDAEPEAGQDTAP